MSESCKHDTRHDAYYDRVKSKLQSLSKEDLLDLVVDTWLKDLEPEELVGMLLAKDDYYMLEDELDNRFSFEKGE